MDYMIGDIVKLDLTRNQDLMPEWTLFCPFIEVRRFCGPTDPVYGYADFYNTYNHRISRRNRYSFNREGSTLALRRGAAPTQDDIDYPVEYADEN